MSSRSIITGIDIGTHFVKVVIANSDERNERGFPRIIGVGQAESRGLRHGYVTNLNEVTLSIAAAIEEAEKRAQVKIKRAFVSIGGIGLAGVTSTSAVIVSRGDQEISALDVKKLHDQCEKDIPPSASLNRKIIHNIPLQYKIDGKTVLGKPEGMKGSRMEVKMLYVTCLEQHLNDILQAVNEAGIKVQDVMAAPIAASLVTLSKSQKIAGCILANIGAETVSIAVFENNVPVSLEVFPIGSTDITNDIALGLKVPLEEAEQLKIGAISGTSYPRKKLEEIVEARLSDIFELIEAHLKKIGRNGLLPAGIIITGGGAGLGTIEDMAKAALKLPSRIGSITSSSGQADGSSGAGASNKQSYKDATWAVAYGLCIFGVNADGSDEDLPQAGMDFGKTFRQLGAWFKQFLP
ncbi:MAG: cell division protein FtsA, cell division protein FtsA [Candidatus Taylorbacteria bacterium]|nr:cell division protein FtsA, cell division protein FtsA [Candidatus Taylorbacteria bacterium]